MDPPYSGFLSRRGFLALAGAGAATALTGCEHLLSFIPPAIGHLPEARQVTPFITPNDDFYLVAIDPEFQTSVTPETLHDWHLELVGLGGETRALGYDDLDARARHTVPYTFECIGNPVGGQLIGNAMWRVVPLRNVLALAPGGIGAARSVMLEAEDGFYSSGSVERATDDYAFLALDMNGVPLPAGHGFPVRVILPDLYGKKQPRWLSRITLLEDESTTSYWERRLWNGDAPPQLEARFDPREAAPAGQPLELTGMGFAGARGVYGVDLSLDDGATWVPAERTTPTQANAWSLWRFVWNRPTPGRHRLAVRVIDAEGRAQSAHQQPRWPSGASGLHRMTMTVR